jgi:predicted small lipoprotein YifL
MIRQRSTFVAASALFGLVILTGCGQKEAAPLPATKSSTAPTGESTENIDAAMAKLSDADRQTAMAQGVCPVTGEALGSMGRPIKVTQGDRHLFVCCAGCEEEAKEKFDEFYAQLNERPQADEKP